MATIEERLRNVRTLEDIVNLLSILFTNMNNQNEIYYNLFINPTPMTLELERYDENGELIKVPIPNRAKDRIWMQTGNGSPEGVIAGNTGTFYLDISGSGDLYFKARGEDTDGWVRVWSTSNLVRDIDFLPPNGNGSQLQRLNANNIDSGTLSVPRGGTGRTELTSGNLLQGNGENPILSSLDINSLVSSLGEFVGMIMWCPIDTIEGNWLVCDGSIYSITERAELINLCNKLGSKYGGDGVTTFGVPNLIDKYIKGGLPEDVGTDEEGQVGKHAHSLNGTTDAENSHTHGGGSLTVPNSYAEFAIRRSGSAGGAFSFSNISMTRGDSDTDTKSTSRVLNFNSENKWSGTTGSGSSHVHTYSGSTDNYLEGTGKNEVDHLVMVPVIRY